MVATGLMYGMFHSWGFTGSEVALLASTTGIWNMFLKLGLPIMAVALLAIIGRATNTLLVPALIGLAFLVGSVVLFAMVLWKKSLARAIGNWLGRIWSKVRRLARKSPVDTWGEGAVRFRKQTIRLVVRRWPALTITTIASHLALWFVLLLSLRHVGCVRTRGEHDPGPRGLRLLPVDLGHPHHARRRGHRGARTDRWSLRRRQDPRRCPARRVQGPSDGCGAPVPDVDVRGPDPAGRLHVPDLAAQEELAEAATGGVPNRPPFPRDPQDEDSDPGLRSPRRQPSRSARRLHGKRFRAATSPTRRHPGGRVRLHRERDPRRALLPSLVGEGLPDRPGAERRPEGARATGARGGAHRCRPRIRGLGPRLPHTRCPGGNRERQRDP